MVFEKRRKSKNPTDYSLIVFKFFIVFEKWQKSKNPTDYSLIVFFKFFIVFEKWRKSKNPTDYSLMLFKISSFWKMTKVKSQKVPTDLLRVYLDVPCISFQLMLLPLLNLHFVLLIFILSYSFKEPNLICIGGPWTPIWWHFHLWYPNIHCPFVYPFVLS